MSEWLIHETTKLPRIYTQIRLDEVKNMLVAAQGLASETFVTKAVDQPADGSILIVKVDSETEGPSADGWGWLDNEEAKLHSLSSGESIKEWSRSCGFNHGASHVVISRKRYALANAPTLQLVHYMRVKEGTGRTVIDKASIKVEPSAGKNPEASEDEYWGFEDQSVPTLVCLARYKRNHELMGELLSGSGGGGGVKVEGRGMSGSGYESVYGMEDVKRLEQEIAALEESNRRLFWT